MDMRSAELLAPLVMRDRLEAAARRRSLDSLRCRCASLMRRCRCDDCPSRTTGRWERVRVIRALDTTGALAIPAAT